MASGEEGPEPLKYQTLTLKVSIHCEGCKKKVKKVLQSMEGVYKITIDSQQQKVVVTGNVAVEILIKKLLKTGKHAELWPEKKPNDPTTNNNTSGGDGDGGGGKKNKNKNKATGKPNEPSENPDTNQTPKASGDDSCAKPDGKTPNNGGKDSPKADKKEAGNSLPPEKQDGASAASSSGGGKKQGKKAQKEINVGGGGGEVQVVSQEMGSKASGNGGGSLPAFNDPAYPMSLPPAYVVSYSSVQPSASYGGAYYPMSMNQSSYVYSGATAAVATGSCYIFSDENVNACRIM